MQLISGYYFCILLPCWTHASVLAVCGSIFRVLCTISCHLWIKIALLPPFQFGCLLFLLLFWLLWLKLLLLCWIRVVNADIPLLFLNLRETLLVLIISLYNIDNNPWLMYIPYLVTSFYRKFHLLMESDLALSIMVCAHICSYFITIFLHGIILLLSKFSKF